MPAPTTSFLAIAGDVYESPPHSTSGTITGVVPVDLMSFDVE